MHHRVERAAIRIPAPERFRVPQIDLEQLPAEHGIAMAAHQAVERADLVPGLEQQLDHVRADVARAAYDQYVQDMAPSSADAAVARCLSRPQLETRSQRQSCKPHRRDLRA